LSRARLPTDCQRAPLARNISAAPMQQRRGRKKSRQALQALPEATRSRSWAGVDATSFRSATQAGQSDGESAVLKCHPVAWWRCTTNTWNPHPSQTRCSNMVDTPATNTAATSARRDGSRCAAVLGEPHFTEHVRQRPAPRRHRFPCAVHKFLNHPADVAGAREGFRRYPFVRRRRAVGERPDDRRHPRSSSGLPRR
jgi:hypothetical protein